MTFRRLFDPASSTCPYVLDDPARRDAVIVDPVLAQIERDLAVPRFTRKSRAEFIRTMNEPDLAEPKQIRTAVPANLQGVIA